MKTKSLGWVLIHWCPHRTGKFGDSKHTGRMHGLQRSRQRLGRFTCKEAKEHHTLPEATSSGGEAWDGFCPSAL